MRPEILNFPDACKPSFFDQFVILCGKVEDVFVAMTKELIIFYSIVGLFTVLQSLAAHPLAQAKTVYQITDRLSWGIGGLLAIGIGVWKPWFTTTWWKAALFAFLLPVLMSSFAQMFLGSLLTMETENKTRIVSRLMTLFIMGSLVFFGIRACGG